MNRIPVPRKYTRGPPRFSIHFFGLQPQGHHLEVRQKKPAMGASAARPFPLHIFRKPAWATAPTAPGCRPHPESHTGGDAAAGCRIRAAPAPAPPATGPTEHSATRPKLSSPALPSLRVEETPMPRAIIKGTVMGPVVTPPESNATARKSPGSKGGQAEHHQHRRRSAGRFKGIWNRIRSMRHHQKGSHTCRHSADQHGVGDAGYLPCQAPVRSGSEIGDDHADQEADQNHHPQLPGTWVIWAPTRSPMGGHGGVRPQRKKSHSYDQQDSAYQKGQQHI